VGASNGDSERAQHQKCMFCEVFRKSPDSPCRSAKPSHIVRQT
jgi:hypothetical protein